MTVRGTLKRVYPILFAIYPILWVAATSTGLFKYSDLLRLVVSAVAGTIVLLAAARLLLRSRARHVAPLIVFALVGWLFGGVFIWRMLTRLAGPIAPAAIVVSAAATLPALWWLVRHPIPAERVSAFLALAGAFLVLQACGLLAIRELRAARTIARNPLVAKLEQPIPVLADAAAGTGPTRPDVYLIVLDMYANSGVLREHFNFDNRPFEDSLRARGFTIPRVIHSNYTSTILSLPSLLNFHHLTELEQDPATLDVVPIHLVMHNRAVRFFVDQGYTFLMFPSPWWRGTASSDYASVNFQGWTGSGVESFLARTELRRVLWRDTALRYLVPGSARTDTLHIARTFEALAKVPGHPSPTFALAHFLLPHPPYVFDAACHPAGRADDTPVSDASAEGKQAYIGQLECLNRRILRLVDRLLAESSTPPVILLQGDHGTFTLSQTRKPRLSLAAMKEATGAFGAYHVPGGAAPLFIDSITLVNTLGYVLRTYFHADLPPESDDVFYAEPGKPYRFIRYRVEELSRSASPPASVGPTLAASRGRGSPGFARHVTSR